MYCVLIVLCVLCPLILCTTYIIYCTTWLLLCRLIIGLHTEIMLSTFIGSILVRTMFATGINNVFFLSIVVALSALLNAPVKPLLDSAIMACLTDKTAYGKSRLYGQIGMGLGSFLVGPLLQHYQLMFLVQALLALPTAFLMSRFRHINTNNNINNSKTNNNNNNNNNNNKSNNNNNKSNNSNSALNQQLAVGRQLLQSFSDPRVRIFFLIVFIIGISSGIIENFAYVRISQLPGGNLSDGSGSGSMLGIMRLASSLAGGPVFWISGSIIHRIGVNGVMAVSLLFYILRFLIYAFAKTAWLALPAEILRGFSFAIFWSAATYYVYSIAPKNLTATMVSYQILSIL
jgi:hypothetical protein